jgi:RimJ/RimL family protein N-acetyltransferase
MKYIGDGRPWGRDRVIQHHRNCLSHWHDHRFGWRAIRAADSDMVLGIAATNILGPLVAGIDHSAIEIGWWLDPHMWAMGLATEAAHAIRDEAFVNLGAKMLVARFQPANHRSERVMIKLGMSCYGDTVGRSGEAVRVYVLHRSEWNERVV